MVSKGGESGWRREEGSGASKTAKTTVAQAEVSSQETAEYIASLLENLRLLAHQRHLPFLSYLLGIALEEANNEKAKRD